MPRSLEELAQRADALADAFEAYEPRPGDRDTPPSPLLAVKLAAWGRDAAERDLAEAVRQARAQAVSWRELGGEAIGTSGEAARQRYRRVGERPFPRLHLETSSVTVASTHEGRTCPRRGSNSRPTD